MAGKKILIVEDEAVVARDLEQTLQTLGYEVVGVAQFAAGSEFRGENLQGYAEHVRGFRRRILSALSPPARRGIAYESAWRLLTGRPWKGARRPGAG